MVSTQIYWVDLMNVISSHLEMKILKKTSVKICTRFY